VEADQRVTGEQAVMGGDVMTNRAERVARNESTARAVNEQLERGHRDQNQPADHLRILCECGWPDCDRGIALTVAEYEHVRADPREFLVVADHVVGDVERVVARTDRYAVVAKREGPAAAIVVEQDPRD
jgi:hypothetical protein